MMDVLMIALTFGWFALAIGYAIFLDSLFGLPAGKDGPG